MHEDVNVRLDSGSDDGTLKRTTKRCQSTGFTVSEERRDGDENENEEEGKNHSSFKGVLLRFVLIAKLKSKGAGRRCPAANLGEEMFRDALLLSSPRREQNKTKQDTSTQQNDDGDGVKSTKR